jgi:putative NADH-flavin reductase
MKLSIIGASRGIGRQLVEQALARGHRVTAMARRPQVLELKHEALTMIPGDIREAEAAARAVAGQEAVCLTLGVGVTWRPVTVFSEGTAQVLAAMAREGVRRLVAITGIGAGESRGHGGLLYDRLVLPFLLRTIYADKDRQETLIRASRVDWTIVRPGFLTNGPLKGKYRALTDLRGVTAGRISRADVAHFLLEELATGRFVRQAVLVTS